jgi:superfamily II DNA/RNA helicase
LDCQFDLLQSNQGRVLKFNRVTYVVIDIDQADRMFDMGFGPQVMKITANTRPDRRHHQKPPTFFQQSTRLNSARVRDGQIQGECQAGLEQSQV